jgi:hypothetical protein
VLFEHFDKELVPLRAKREELKAMPSSVRRSLADGASKARLMARETMGQVRAAMGLGSEGSRGGALPSQVSHEPSIVSDPPSKP